MLFFSFPFSDKIYTTDDSPGRNAVSFLSFDQSEIIGFEGDCKEISIDEFLNKPILTADFSTILPHFEQETESSYTQKLTDVIAFIRENRLKKLVISRRKSVDFNDAQVNLSQTFLNLKTAYPNAFVYVFVKDGKCWIGAFSELLGKFNKNTAEFETMALAGTIPVNEEWTRKEIEEQKPVAEYILNILKQYSSTVQVSSTADHLSGNIKHLRTDFKAEIKAHDLENIIAELHPTPAVCGIPKEICTKAIAAFEDHPRKFYAGYIKVETDESVQYFVNLRCAEFFQNAALVYVGGGITAESSPQKEWRETELKSEAIIKNLSFI